MQFASVTRSGYDAHFATLATLMFREAGVPARYMEGYYLSPKEMAEYADTEEIELEVYDNAAHAWTEIYEDGVGWVPVEVTPGYFSLKEEETPQLTESVQRISKRTPKPFYDSVPLPEENSQTPENVEQKGTIELFDELYRLLNNQTPLSEEHKKVLQNKLNSVNAPQHVVKVL